MDLLMEGILKQTQSEKITIIKIAVNAIITYVDTHMTPIEAAFHMAKSCARLGREDLTMICIEYYSLDHIWLSVKLNMSKIFEEACFSGNKNFVINLLNLKSCLHSYDYDAAIAEASKNNHNEIAEYIIDNYAKNIDNSLKLLYHMISINNVIIARKLLLHLKDQIKSSYSIKIINKLLQDHITSNHANIEMIEFLLYDFMEIIIHDNGERLISIKNSALFWSCMTKKEYISTYLIERGATNCGNTKCNQRTHPKRKKDIEIEKTQI
jgi:hypothetical protein